MTTTADAKLALPTEIGGKPILINVTLPVPFERITNCITGAIEGGSTYWCNTFELFGSAAFEALEVVRQVEAPAIQPKGGI